jgi:hypothetical protein
MGFTPSFMILAHVNQRLAGRDKNVSRKELLDYFRSITHLRYCVELVSQSRLKWHAFADVVKLVDTLS